MGDLSGIYEYGNHKPVVLKVLFLKERVLHEIRLKLYNFSLHVDAALDKGSPDVFYLFTMSTACMRQREK